MASKTSRSNGRAGANTATRAATPSANLFATPSAGTDAAMSYTQGQFQALIAMADLMFKGAEQMRRTQMEAAHAAHQRHEQAQAQVAAAATPTELWQVQSELLRFDMESAGKYWQELAAVCASAQTEAYNLLTRQAATLAVPAAQGVAIPALPQAAAAPTGEGMDAAQAWNRWMDLSKQWTDMLYRTEASLH